MSTGTFIVDRRNPSLYADVRSIDNDTLSSLIIFAYNHYDEFWHRSTVDPVSVYNAWSKSQPAPLSGDIALFALDYIQRIRSKEDIVVLCSLADIDID